MEIIINSVRINPKTVKIEYTERDDRGPRSGEIEWKHKPRNSFTKALQALATHVIDISEFPKEWLEQIEVRGVSFTYEGERETMGAVIMATRKLEHSSSPLNITTPYKIEYDGDKALEGDSKVYLVPDCVAAFHALQDEAEEYLGGAHAADNQEDMFNAGAKEKKEKPAKRSVSKETIEKFGMDKSDGEATEPVTFEVTEKREKELLKQTADDLDVKKIPKKAKHKK